MSRRDDVSARLAEAAESWLLARGATVLRYEAPAAFEVAQLAAWIADSGEVDAIVACGCIVRGESVHDRHLGAAVTGSLLEAAVRTGVPIGNAVLTVESRSQAAARSGGAKGNRGEDAARAAAGLLHARRSALPRRAAAGGRRLPVDLGPAPLRRRGG